MKILVVDDSRIMRSIIKNSIKSKNIADEDIYDAEDGEAAIKIMDSVDIGILLVDWNMPKLNGLDLVKKVRAMEKYKEIPIVMITSEAAKYNVMEALKAGVSDYIVKPISGSTLESKLSKYIQQE